MLTTHSCTRPQLFCDLRFAPKDPLLPPALPLLSACFGEAVGWQKRLGTVETAEQVSRVCCSTAGLWATEKEEGDWRQVKEMFLIVSILTLYS